MTDQFDHILNWELKAGSHDFPGPHGGTCINEAAIVAAGFEYKAIQSAHDCPPCFSRPIAAYAIGLNDRMSDALRNELLMPFVTRLAGTADTPEVERARVHHMAIRGVNLILALMCRKAKREDLALKCDAVKTVAEARAVAGEVRNVLRATAYAAATATAYAAATAHAAATAAATAYAAAAATAAAAAVRREIYVLAVQILDEAIKMGNQGDTISVDLAVKRMNAARELASASA